MLLSRRFRVAGTFLSDRAETIRRSVRFNTRFILQREPDNQYDSNAITVQVRSGGNIRDIGYVPAKIAEEMAPLLDEGKSFDVRFVTKILDNDDGKLLALIIKATEKIQL